MRLDIPRHSLAQLLAPALALALALSLSACGGGSASTGSKSVVSRVFVMGDSLADVGTFGFKFTVQNGSSAGGYPIWPQLVANGFGLAGSAQCNFYLYTGSTFAANPTAGCTNYAIGGGRVVVNIAHGGAANPQTVGTQLATRALAGNYLSTDLVLIDGGGNDAADLVGAYLGAATGASGLAAYQAFLLQQLDAPTLAALLPQTDGAALAAGAYMQKLADTFYAAILAQTLNKGASKVAVLNVPDITLTPRFQMVLASVNTQSGATAAQQLQAAIRQWIGAFNARLQANVGADPRVALVDFNADLNDEIAHPINYGLSNVSAPACPITGVDSSGLPTYDFPSCSSANLDAQAGNTAGWWSRYTFSDGFHPTPYGHSLLAASVSRALARAGWL